jgi:rubrerythrin
LLRSYREFFRFGVQDELERAFSKVQVDDEAVMTSMKQTLARLEQRSEALKKLPGHSSRSSLYREIESQASALRQGHEALQASIASRMEAEQQKRRPARAGVPTSAESDDAKRLREVEEALKVGCQHLCLITK